MKLNLDRIQRFSTEMANRPESRNVDPRVVHGGGEGASTRTRARQALALPVNLYTATPALLIEYLRDDRYREHAIALLCKRRSNELAQNLWSSFNTVHILLQEVLSVYTLLSPPMLTKPDSDRVCNAIVLFQENLQVLHLLQEQYEHMCRLYHINKDDLMIADLWTCIALNPDTRMGLIRAAIPVYLYPFIKNSEMQRPFEHLKITSLSVISALVKTEDSDTPKVIHYLLGTEIFPLLIGCMEHGNENTKIVATFIVSRILKHNEGTHYMGFRDRFNMVMSLLRTMINNLPQEPPLQLLKHILSCYLGMAEVSKFVGAQARDAFKRFLPQRIVHPNFIRVANGSPSTKQMFGTLLSEFGHAMVYG